jgi:hypothetical protein
MAMVTIQYEVTIARRGQLTTTVKERTFKTEDAMAKWLDRPENEGNVTVLRYSYGEGR